MPRDIRIDGDIAYVTLTQGFTAIIDAEDAHMVSSMSWSTMRSKRTEYAVSKKWVKGENRQETILLHRLVLGAKDGIHVDHKDGNALDCRKANLRFATYEQNNTNSRTRTDNKLGLKGVCKHSLCNKYRASISFRGVRRNLGLFKTAEEAYAAYCAANAEIHGEFGRTK